VRPHHEPQRRPTFNHADFVNIEGDNFDAAALAMSEDTNSNGARTRAPADPAGGVITLASDSAELLVTGFVPTPRPTNAIAYVRSRPQASRRARTPRTRTHADGRGRAGPATRYFTGPDF
jgi:hypothetical protein